jgi:hypothetical protein
MKRTEFNADIFDSLESLKKSGGRLYDKITGLVDKSKEPNVVWVTFDPLIERVICVHDTPDTVCDVCKPIHEKRIDEKTYHLEEQRFEVKTWDEVTPTE